MLQNVFPTTEVSAGLLFEDRARLLLHDLILHPLFCCTLSCPQYQYNKTAVYLDWNDL